MQWLMLQQEQPEDYVIATGEQHSVRAFVDQAAAELGISLTWRGSGVEETGVVETINNDIEDLKVKPGHTIVRVDPRYFRPTEVETLLGDPAKAKQKLGWTPSATFADLVSEMARADLIEAKKDALCLNEGYNTYNYHE
jgi:GDPmannose 4,6-dehydratase